jgi:hypothetical protein
MPTDAQLGVVTQLDLRSTAKSRDFFRNAVEIGWKTTCLS